MDNEFVLEIDGVNYRFKLKSQKIVALEKAFGKNIFMIFDDMTAGSIATILKAALIEPEDIDEFELLDKLLTKYTLLEIPKEVLNPIAVKSGLIKQKTMEDIVNNGEKEAKN